MDRQQHRKLVRERVNDENKKLAAQFAIPKAFIAHARRHGMQVVDIIQAQFKHKDAGTLRGKKA
jgi:hypothetical protein